MSIFRPTMLVFMTSILSLIASANDSIPANKPLVTATMVNNKPAIDGLFSEQEWQHASCVSGFFEGSSLASRQVKTYIAYDKENLYLAMLSPIDPHGLVADENKKDGNLWMDDAIEIFLSPPDQKVYRLIFNSKAILYDSRFDSKIANEDITWDSGIDVKCGVKDAVWVSEICIPFKNINLTTPEDGAVWRVNFYRDWKRPMEWAAWSPSTHFVDFETMGDMVFKKDAPYVKLPNIEVKNGKVSINGKSGFANPGATDIETRLMAYASGENIYNKAEVLKIGPGMETDISFTKDFFDTNADRLLFTVADKKTREILARFVYLDSKEELAPSAVNVAYVPYEYQKKALVVVDIVKSPGKSTELKGRVELFNLATGNLIATAELSPFEASKAKADLDIKDVVPRNYKLVTTINNRAGERVHKKEILLTKPSDEWVGANKAPSDEVLWPWTPMSVKSRKDSILIKCWGREYDFGDSPFPAGIVTQDKQILASPVSLTIKTSNEQNNYKSALLKVVRDTPAEVTITGRGSVGDIKIDTQVRVEFDGLMVFDVTLTPNSPTTVNEIALNIPLKAEYAKLMHVPGRHIISGEGGFSGVTGHEEGWQWQAPFAYYMWVGDEDRGIQWFAESNSNWKIGDDESVLAKTRQNTGRGDGTFGYSRNDKDTISLTRQKDVMLWHFNMVQKPIILRTPMTLSFGLHVTPVKPRPAGWRGWGMQRNMALIWTTKESSKYFGYAEVPDAGKVWHKELVNALHGEKKKVLQYAILTMLSEGSPEYQYYHNEWQAIPGWTDDRSADVVAMGKAIHGMCPKSSGWIDFASYKQAKFVKDNNLDGIYWDNSWPWYCNNENHGCKGELPILAYRELYKRTYAKLKRMGNDKLVITHCSGGLVMPMLSFCDGYVVGEQFGGQVNKNDFYMENFDWFRAEAMGRQFGLVPLVLPMARGPWANKELTENFMGMALLHDASNIALMGGLEGATVFRIWGILDAFGISKDDVEFVPYWVPSKSMITSSRANVMASVYIRKGIGSLVVIGNKDSEPSSVALQFDFDRLGLKAQAATCMDEMSQQKIILDKGQITLSVPARGFRIITIKSNEPEVK